MTPIYGALALMTTIFATTDAACTIPKPFVRSDWIDNVKGDVNFSTWKMQNWMFRAAGTNVTDWELVDNTQFEAKGYLALRSVQTFTRGAKTYYSFMCLKFTKLTDSSYEYYTMHDEESVADGARVIVAEHDDLTEFSQVCNETYDPSNNPKHLIIKRNSDPGVTCPKEILANYHMTMTVSGTPACKDVYWDGCTMNKKISVNATACGGNPFAFAGNGTVTCVSSSSTTDTVTVFLYDTTDTADNVNTFRFACMVSNKDGSRVTIVPTTCVNGQTPTTIPAGTSGQTIVNTEIENCRPYTPTEADDEGIWSVPVIVGVSLGAGFVLIILVVIIVCCCMHRDKKF